MKAYVIKFLQQGVWASLSGGWYYDDNHSTFTNIFHMYSWLFLFLLPLKLYLVSFKFKYDIVKLMQQFSS